MNARKRQRPVSFQFQERSHVISKCIFFRSEFTQKQYDLYMEMIKHLPDKFVKKQFVCGIEFFMRFQFVRQSVVNRPRFVVEYRAGIVRAVRQRKTGKIF